MTEARRKLEKMRGLITRTGASALRLRGTDWFSWATAGGSNVVIFSGETGIAEVLVTKNRALILTTPIESTRLREEELPPEFDVIESPWAQIDGWDRLVKNYVSSGKILSDRPKADESPLPDSFWRDRTILEAEEIERYRDLGRDAASAMTTALRKARPDWSERRLAGEGARSLWERGIHPVLILVAGARRLEYHRHPCPTAEPLGRRAMMVFCARRHGLFANLTRFVCFSKPSDLESARLRTVSEIEGRIFSSLEPGKSLANVYEDIINFYRSVGEEAETALQHFGGLTGYLSREALARPEETSLVSVNQAFAWNPTLPGSKIEDTVLLTEGGLDVLTSDLEWPTFERQGLRRPDTLVMT